MILFFFNDTATTEIYTLSLHDALPISRKPSDRPAARSLRLLTVWAPRRIPMPLERACSSGIGILRSEEHTSELQSQSNLVCRLLLEKKKILHVLLQAKAHIRRTERKRG